MHKESVELLGNGFYKTLPLKDFDSGSLVFLDSVAQVHLSAAKVLLTPQSSTKLYGVKAMEEDRVLPGHKYRHDSVYIVGDKLEHIGLPWQRLPDYMEGLVAFINEESTVNDLLKAALIHFYIAYLHPYFDGNGRMARLLRSAKYGNRVKYRIKSE